MTPKINSKVGYDHFWQRLTRQRAAELAALRLDVAKLCLAAGLFALVLLATGCGTVGGSLVERKSVTPVVTQAAARTNIIGTNVQIVIPAPVTNYVTNVTYEPSATASNVIAAVSALAAVPSPASPWLQLAGWGAAAGLSLLVRAKNRRAELAEEDASQANSVANTIIAGIETLNSKEAKEAVRKISLARGNASEVHTAVQIATR